MSDQEIAYDISTYKPGKFQYLMAEPFAEKLWGFLANKTSINLMVKAVMENKPAIYYLLETIEQSFDEQFTSQNFDLDEIAVFVNNMIKQIMELSGYSNTACGICRNARFIKSSGMYVKK